MKLTQELVAIVALSITSATAQAVTCDGNQQPDWDACDVIAAEYNGQPGYIDGHVQDDGGCVGLYLNSDSGPNGANCVLNACYESGPARDVHFAKAYIYTDYQFIRDQCRSEGAGGRTYPPLNEGYDYLGVSNNPNYNPSVKAKREHARDLMTRQQSGDNGYVLYSKSTNINKPGARFAVTGRLPAGSMYTTTETSSSTTGISASVDVGVDLFEVFTASVGLSVSQDYTVSSASGVSVNVDCADGQDGIVYWVPLYDYYTGYYTPSNDDDDFYVPVDSEASRSSYEVSCLG